MPRLAFLWLWDVHEETASGHGGSTQNLMNRHHMLNTSLLPWTPFRRGLREEINLLFPGVAQPVSAPPIDLYEQEGAFVLHCELPGMGRDQIAVSFQEGVLSISGERKPDRAPEGAFRVERRTGRFERRIALPAAVDPARIEATYVDGVLRVLLPKPESAKPRVIPVQVPETVDRS